VVVRFDADQEGQLAWRGFVICGQELPRQGTSDDNDETEYQPNKKTRATHGRVLLHSQPVIE
jgi:hypothetical protein